MPERLRLPIDLIFLRHARDLVAYVKRHWPLEQDYSDIVQDTYLRFRKQAQPESIENPRAYLFQTAMHLGIDQQRRQNIRERHIQPDAEADIDEVVDPGLRPDRLLEIHQDLEGFAQRLDELPELTRNAFVLYVIEGFPHAEVARRLDISVRTSKTYVKNALRHLAHPHRSA